MKDVSKVIEPGKAMTYKVLIDYLSPSERFLVLFQVPDTIARPYSLRGSGVRNSEYASDPSIK